MPALLNQYLSAGANRHSAAADWSDNGVLVFGSDSNVAVAQWPAAPVSPHGVGIRALLTGHTDAVQAVRFIPRISQEEETTYFVSGAAKNDGSLRLWASSDASPTFSCVQTIDKAHDGAVNCIATAAPSGPSKRRLVATGGADATIKIWSFDGSSQTLTLVQTIETAPRFYPLSLALSILDSSSDDAFILAAAGSRNAIQVFVTSPSAAPQFSLQATLSGHQDWVRSLDITFESPTSQDLLIASASGDKYIRLWRVYPGSDLPASAPAADPAANALILGATPANKAHKLKSGERVFGVTFEALLLGHEDWIYSARWRRFGCGGPEEDKPRLLSASADNSLAVWEADPASGIWVTAARLGEISQEKGATTATGSTGGFWTGLWGPDGNEVAVLARTGSWRRWRREGEGDSAKWTQHVGITGHTRAVAGVSWSRDGNYLLSTSLDQTTRLHSAWKSSSGESWHEMSRPQIHGYDLNCIDSLGDSQFVSGADEKLMRVFHEPKAVAKLLQRLSGIEPSNQDVDALPEGADMPVLGLSNKAVETTTDNDQPATAANEHASVLSAPHPPTEDVLSRYTLWPETEKLYGHGYEISCLAASHDGTLVASACRASSTNHAVVRLFETARWTEIKPPLSGHSLTATRVRFSPGDGFLLSVGRDRAWAVFVKDKGAAGLYVPFQTMAKAHSRMILDAAWVPATARAKPAFATAGRDKQVRVWTLSFSTDGQETKTAKPEFGLAATITADEPVTAVDFSPYPLANGNTLLAVGTEAGKLFVHELGEALDTVSTTILSDDLAIAKPILQLSWRPRPSSPDSPELAVAAEDGSLRILVYSSSVVEQ